MRAIGVVAEYNPFHNGHAYHLQYVRHQLKADVIVVVMSGNFLQRGEPALVDKWLRAEMALRGGADLVFELPLVHAVQPADYFAEGAVEILRQLQVKGLSFGAETADSQAIVEAASLFNRHEAQIYRQVRNLSGTSLTFPQKIQTVLTEELPEFPLDLTTPNNLLAFTYAKESLKQDFHPDFYPLKREGAGHHQKEMSGVFASGQAIRKALLEEGEFPEEVMPAPTVELLKEHANQWLSWEHFWPYLQYEVTCSSADDLARIYQVDHGLEHRLKKVVTSARTYEEFMNQMQTSAYTKTRLQRMFVYILLKMLREEVTDSRTQPAALRMLGFSEIGRAYLRTLNREGMGEIVTTINQKNAQQFAQDIRAGEIYRLPRFQTIKKQDFTRKPCRKV